MKHRSLDEQIRTTYKEAFQRIAPNPGVRHLALESTARTHNVTEGRVLLAIEAPDSDCASPDFLAYHRAKADLMAATSGPVIRKVGKTPRQAVTELITRIAPTGHPVHIVAFDYEATVNIRDEQIRVLYPAFTVEDGDRIFLPAKIQIAESIFGVPEAHDLAIILTVATALAAGLTQDMADWTEE